METLFIVVPEKRAFPEIKVEVLHFIIEKECKKTFLINGTYIPKDIVNFKQSTYGYFLQGYFHVLGLEDYVRINLCGEEIWLESRCCLKENLIEAKEFVLTNYILKISEAIGNIELEISRYKNSLKSVETYLLSEPKI